ncbi:hypothetical protein [Metabacillus iocasae]|uniref:Chromosome segregation ATPase n=1 Tax=Priestia iocasae TaxID=2291674 RepID=A0ABS2QVN2_9BACI|nr:hypothetical protein [Metabacillus iocasae]MBM7703002.1 chromosome segregation ATPase [Metabacillus iocasae]
MEAVLKQILSELQSVHTRMSSLEEGQIEMRKDIFNLQSDVSSLKSEQQEMRNDISNLQSDVTELKEYQKQKQKEIMSTLGSYMDKIVAYVDDKTEALNKRVYKVETDIERLLRS